MEVRPGYKRTEAGVIPEDWEELTVGELIEFQGGSQPEKSVFSVTPRQGFVRLIQIRDYKSDKFEVFAPSVLLRRFCDEQDIMIGRYGPPVFQILRGLSGAYNVALIKACPRPEIDRDFAYYFLKQESLFEFIDKLSRRSSGQTGVDLSELRRYPLPLPALPEQRAIAAALSDMDALLGGLEQLIAKKRDLKQAAMQQLLTGQTRLPGFSGEWEVKELGDLVQFMSGGTPSKSNESFWNGDIPWISATSLRTLYIWRSDNNVTKEAVAAGSKMAPVGSTLLLVRGSALHNEILAGLVTKPVCFNQDVKALVPKPVLLPNFLTLLIRGRASELLKLVSSAGNSAGVLDTKLLKAFQIKLPALPEQTAIATVLSDMDAELLALVARRDKTRDLKQAMMQELLTGRIRLV